MDYVNDIHHDHSLVHAIAVVTICEIYHLSDKRIDIIRWILSYGTIITCYYPFILYFTIRSVIAPDRPFLTVGWLQAGESWSSIVHLFALLQYPWIWNSQRLRLFASASPHRMVQSHFYPFTDRALKFQHDNSSISSPLSWNTLSQETVSS